MQCPPRWEFSLEMEMLGLMGDEKERNLKAVLKD